jgi:hypothetical protein
VAVLFHVKLQTTLPLKKKNWKGDTKCQLCGVKEDTNHIMFRCVNIVVRKKKRCVNIVDSFGRL